MLNTPLPGEKKKPIAVVAKQAGDGGFMNLHRQRKAGA